MLPFSCFQNVHLSGSRCVSSIHYWQTNHSTIMLSTPSLLLIIDQVITACTAPHTDIRCQERENLARERSWETVSTLMGWSTAGFWIAKPVTYKRQLNVKTFGFQLWSAAESHKSCSKFRSVKEAGWFLSEACCCLQQVSNLPLSALHLFATLWQRDWEQNILEECCKLYFSPRLSVGRKGEKFLPQEMSFISLYFIFL